MKILDCINPIFDSNGHFYLELKDQVYEFSIDNKNNLEIFKIFNNDNFQYRIKEESEDNFTDQTRIDLLAKSNTLKSKIIREYIKEKEDDPDIDNESDEDIDAGTIDNINSKLQYFPEDLEYIEEGENSEECDSYSYNETQFRFYGNIQIKKLIEIDITEINEINGKYILDKDKDIVRELSNYDTFLYNGDNEHAELVFISKLNVINSSYRLFAFKDGSIFLKMVGSSKKTYKIKLDGDDIVLEKI
jgi:hypothetical protein